MTSIRTRLLIGFLGIIVLMGIVGAAIIVSSRGIEREHQGYDNALYLEFGLIERTDALLRVFRDFRAAPSAARESAYAAARAALVADMARIEGIAVGGSRPAISGLRSTLTAMVAATDDGMDGVRAKNFSQTDAALDRSGRIRTFVDANVATLILEELERSRAGRAAADRRSFLVFTIGAVALLTIGAASALYGLVLARRISTPLVRLTAAAERIAAGSYDSDVDGRLFLDTAEIASLARSFKTMATSLGATMGGLKAATEKATQAQHDMESKNELLEKLNRLFITREGRITELKQEIIRLGGAVAAKESDDVPTS